MEERDGSEVLGRQRAVKDAKGSHLTLKPLGISDYGTIQDAALDHYRRQQIKVWTKNQDLIPEEDRKDWIRDAFEKARDISYEELPRKTVGDTEVEFAIWWMSTSPKGMLFALWLSAKKDAGQNGLQLDDIEERFSLDGALSGDALEEAAQQLGDLSEPKIAGNGEAPPSVGQKRKRRKRRQEK